MSLQYLRFLWFLLFFFHFRFAQRSCEPTEPSHRQSCAAEGLRSNEDTKECHASVTRVTRTGPNEKEQTTKIGYGERTFVNVVDFQFSDIVALHIQPE